MLQRNKKLIVDVTHPWISKYASVELDLIFKQRVKYIVVFTNVHYSDNESYLWIPCILCNVSFPHFVKQKGCCLKVFVREHQISSFSLGGNEGEDEILSLCKMPTVIWSVYVLLCISSLLLIV